MEGSEDDLDRDLTAGYTLAADLFGAFIIWLIGFALIVLPGAASGFVCFSASLIVAGVWTWLCGMFFTAAIGADVRERAGPVMRAALEVEKVAGFGPALRFLAALFGCYVAVLGLAWMTGVYAVCIPGALVGFVIAVLSYMKNPFDVEAEGENVKR